MLESNLLITPPIDHPPAIHDPNTGFIYPLIHMYPWKGVSSLSNITIIQTYFGMYEILLS